MRNSVVTLTNDAKLPSHVEFVPTIPNFTTHVARETFHIVTQCKKDVNKGVMSQLRNVTTT
jgi:hypothetical protein